jgi:hypothetical protein
MYTTLCFVTLTGIYYRYKTNLSLDCLGTKNFGPKPIIDELRRQHISDSHFPSEKQLQNKLHYYWKSKFNFMNEITPLELNLRQFQFTNNEMEDQIFIYHYRTDQKDQLILGDGSDR